MTAPREALTAQTREEPDMDSTEMDPKLAAVGEACAYLNYTLTPYAEHIEGLDARTAPPRSLSTSQLAPVTRG